MMKQVLMRTSTGMEAPELPLLQRISSLELKASEIAAQILCRVQVTDTSQHQLFRGDCESGLHVQIAAKKPLLKDTNNNKRLACAKKHEQWIIDWWKCVLWSGVQLRDFWFQPPCLYETRCGRTVDLRMCISNRKAWVRSYGVGVLCW